MGGSMFSKLGRFDIKDVIGRGAMGEVYLGVDPLLGREVAIKTIVSSALPEDQARQRFEREAKAAAILNHPNIVTIHEMGEDQGALFIAMERLKGQDLEQALLQRSLSLVEYLEVLAQVCDGLDAAHRNHIIHRDIKPSNIMVAREGRKLHVKIMDFGVARLKDSAMTMVGTVVGTVNYIAPEYIKSGEPDARSDLFAVGVMLYECISGRKPFDGGTASTVLFKIVNDPPDPLDLSMLQGLSPALRNMTERALAKDPDDRFQTAEEFALALRAAKDPAWSGRLDETTVRMRIRPVPTPEPARIEPLAAATLAAIKAKTAGQPSAPKPMNAAKPAASEKTAVTPVSVSHSEETVQAAKAGTQEVPVPAGLVRPEIGLASSAKDAGSDGHKAVPGRAEASNAIDPMAADPRKTVIFTHPELLANQSDGPRAVQAPATELIATAKAITAEVAVPPSLRNEDKPAEPSAGQAPSGIKTPVGERETALPTTAPDNANVLEEAIGRSAEFPATRTPVPAIPDLAAPENPTPATSAGITVLASSKDITQEIVVVPPLAVPELPHAAKTELLGISKAAEPSESSKVPPEASVARTKDITQEVVVAPPVQMDLPHAARTEAIAIPKTTEKVPEPSKIAAEPMTARATQEVVAVTPPPIPESLHSAGTKVIAIPEMIQEPTRQPDTASPVAETPSNKAKDITQEVVVAPPTSPALPSTAKTQMLPVPEILERATEKPVSLPINATEAKELSQEAAVAPPPLPNSWPVAEKPSKSAIEPVAKQAEPAKAEVPAPAASPDASQDLAREDVAGELHAVQAKTEIFSPAVMGIVPPTAQTGIEPPPKPTADAAPRAVVSSAPDLPDKQEAKPSEVSKESRLEVPGIPPVAVSEWSNEPALRPATLPPARKKSRLPMLLGLSAIVVAGAAGYFFFWYRNHKGATVQQPPENPVSVPVPVAPEPQPPVNTPAQPIETPAVVETPTTPPPAAAAPLAAPKAKTKVPAAKAKPTQPTAKTPENISAPTPPPAPVATPAPATPPPVVPPPPVQKPPTTPPKERGDKR
jgi:serine/threonine protein kinase